MSDSPFGRALTGLAALLGLAAPACIDAQEVAVPSGVAPVTSAPSSPRRPALDRERPPRVATATFALG